VRAAIVLAGLAVGILAYRVQEHDLGTTHARALATVAVGWAFLVAGLVAWSRRPGNRMGPLMVATALALLARQLRYSHDQVAFTTFFALGELGYALVAHVTLAYPTGIVRDRAERWFLGVAYTVAIAFPLAILAFYDGIEQLRYFDPLPRNSALLVHGDASLARTLQDVYAITAYGVLSATFIVLVVRKWLRATPRSRRMLAPLLLAAAVAALRAVFDSVLTFATPPPAFVYDNLFWWQIAGLIALPLALLAGLLKSRLAQASIGDLVVRLERAPPDRIREELAAALGDPSLEIALWLPERGELVDERGRAVALPYEDPARAVTKLEHEGEPLAALVHDAQLVEEPELLSAAAAAARLALENARLHVELRAQLEKVKESRARIVAAADEERRRIERDLHDGLQQQLVALGIELASERRRLSKRIDPDVDHVLEDAAVGIKRAVRDLRELARGIHPVLLSEGGLAAALEALAARAPVSVSVDSTAERFPPAVEAAAYFVACEALTNVAKHASATEATIRAHRRNGALVVEISDDGVGGARLGGGGLSGLVDRVEAHGGRLRVESRDGDGTTVIGEIPCAS
jgi:signal transduction histidine kinase